MPPPDEPLITAMHDGRRRVVAAADAAAIALGLYSGMKLAHAQAMVPGLAIAEADAEEEATTLAVAAAWCLRYAPLTAPDPPDGIFIDVTGCAHLFGGEAALLADMTDKFGRAGFALRAAIADTPGAAWAVARHGETPVVPPGGAASVLADLPVAALRLPEEMITTLRRLGLERIGQLEARAALTLRFGPVLMRRLDQALGRVDEPIRPVLPPATISARGTFAEPISTPEAFTEVIGRLVADVCGQLERAGKGARRLDLLFERVDGTTQAIRIGTARPVRAAPHLGRLLEERIEAVDPGAGVDAMHLVVSLAERLPPVQAESDFSGEGEAGIGVLIDRLVNRLGSDHVTRMAPVESDIPERSLCRRDPLAPDEGRSWPETLPRPIRLFDPPVPVNTMSMLPDHPPVQFTWRHVRHRVRHADGPERIHGEWWRQAGEVWSVRDYFAVEDEAGARFWLYRQGDGVNARSGDMQWFLHGVF